MKKPINYRKIITFFLCIIFIFICGFIYYLTTYYNNEYPQFSTYSNKPDGYRALFLLTKKMGYKTSRYELSSKFLNNPKQEGVMLIILPDKDLINIEEFNGINEWLSNNNTLVLVTNTQNATDINLDYLINSEEVVRKGFVYDKLYQYSVNNNNIYIFNEAELSNENINNYNDAITLMKILSASNTKNVLFNEYYHGIQKAAPTVLEVLGETGELIFIQFIIAILAIMIASWKVFGLPKKQYSIEKRIENENMYALSNLYRKYKGESIVLLNFLNRFETELCKYLGKNGLTSAQIIDAVSYDKKLKGLEADKLLITCHRYINDNKKDSKLLSILVRRIDEIREVLYVGKY